jgi:DNA repair exonuclease SbcCD ATPase subunit
MHLKESLDDNQRLTQEFRNLKQQKIEIEQQLADEKEKSMKEIQRLKDQLSEWTSNFELEENKVSSL